MRIPDAKAAVDKEWKKVETILVWQLGKVKSEKDDFLEAQRDEKKVHFATLMDICHLKNAALEHQFQKCQGRVVLRGERCEDDDSASPCSIYWTMFTRFANDCCMKYWMTLQD